MRGQIQEKSKPTSEGLLSLYKNVDLDKVLRSYREKLLDLRRCL